MSLAEADGNRTRLVEVLDHVGVEDRGGHQAPIRLRPRILERVGEGEGDLLAKPACSALMA